MRLLTVCSVSYIPLASVMLESAAALHPELRPTLLVSDTSVQATRQLRETALSEMADLLCCADLNVDFLESARTYYDVLEFNSALKVLGSAYLLASGQECLFLDPDMVLYDRIDGVVSTAGEVIYTAHTHAPFPEDGHGPNDLEMCRSGTANGGILLTRAGGMTALNWLSRHAKYHWFVAPELGMYADQLWISCLADLFVGRACVAREPGTNVAYWNLHERPLKNAAGCVRLADGSPLRLFHFSGFPFPNDGQLSKHSRRTFDGDTQDAIASLCRDYEARLVRAKDKWGHLRGDIAFCSDPLPQRLARAAELYDAPELRVQHPSSLLARMKRKVLNF
jgi:hypothetical protein